MLQIIVVLAIYTIHIEYICNKLLKYKTFIDETHKKKRKQLEFS